KAEPGDGIAEMAVGELDDGLATLRQAAGQVRIIAGVDEIRRHVLRRQREEGRPSRRTAREPFVLSRTVGRLIPCAGPGTAEESGHARLALDKPLCPRRGQLLRRRYKAA